MPGLIVPLILTILQQNVFQSHGQQPRHQHHRHPGGANHSTVHTMQTLLVSTPRQGVDQGPEGGPSKLYWSDKIGRPATSLPRMGARSGEEENVNTVRVFSVTLHFNTSYLVLNFIHSLRLAFAQKRAVLLLSFIHMCIMAQGCPAVNHLLNQI